MSSILKNTLVVGMGEVGSAIASIFKDKYPVFTIDKGEEIKDFGNIDVMHVCFPYSDKFKEQVNEYIDKYRPRLTVIHSTVPVGITDSFDGLVYHSPIRGKHPNLKNSILTFVKDIGGNNSNCPSKCAHCTDCKGKMMAALDLVDYFKSVGIPANYEGLSARDTEFAKIMCTTRYGWEIVFCKEMKRMCDEYGISFDFAYSIFNKDYNAGYDALGDVQFHRSILKPMDGKMGGHCVINNCKLDKNFITNTILERDALYENTI